MSRKITIIIAMSVLVFAGLGCQNTAPAAPQPVTLEYWRMDEDPAVLDGVIEAYRKLHPHVTIKVSSLNSKDYEKLVLEAMAEGRGPDLFSLPNTSLGNWGPKLLPLPPEAAIPTQVIDQNKKIVWSVEKKPTMTLRQMREMYVQAVVDELTWNYSPDPKVQPTTHIWGVAYSIDNLALFYNNELMRKANIEKPPRTWAEFQQQATKMTVFDDAGDIRQSGAALGGSDNVKYSTELLTMLMAQNGADMGTQYQPTFNRYSADTQSLPETPGVQALVFYQSFATKNSRSYSWSYKMPDSLDAFVEGRTAMFFGLPQDRDLIRKRAPKLDFGMTIVPQIDQNRKWNPAIFNVEGVSRLTANPDVAWDFLQFAADPDNVGSYLEQTKRPSAALSLLDTQKLDPDVAPFALQALIAKTWYEGKDYSAVRSGFKTMIDWRPTVERPAYQYILNIVVQEMTQSYY